MVSADLGVLGRRLALMAAMAAMLTASHPGAAFAQQGQRLRPPAVETPDLDADEPDEPLAPAPANPGTDGSLVFHGNYCGPGSRGEGRPPIDALDEACMHHDACSPPIGTALPSCGCNQRLFREAAAVARNPRTPEDVRIAAQFVSEGAKVLACQR